MKSTKKKSRRKATRSTSSIVKPREQLPAPRFHCTHNGQDVIVIVPARVLTSERARIVGCEWGPANYQVRRKARGWLYWLIDATATTSAGQFAASEEELVAWQP